MRVWMAFGVLSVALVGEAVAQFKLPWVDKTERSTERQRESADDAWWRSLGVNPKVRDEIRRRQQDSPPRETHRLVQADEAWWQAMGIARKDRSSGWAQRMARLRSQGVNFAYYWKKGDQTLFGDTRDSKHRHMVIVGHEWAHRLRAVSILVTEGACQLGVEVGANVEVARRGARVTGVLSRGGRFGNRTFAVVPPPARMLAGRPTVIHIYRSDRSRRHCKFTVFLRYATFSAAFWKATAANAVRGDGGTADWALERLFGQRIGASSNPSGIGANTLMWTLLDAWQEKELYKVGRNAMLAATTDLALAALEKQTGRIDADVRWGASFVAALIGVLDDTWFSDVRQAGRSRYE